MEKDNEKALINEKKNNVGNDIITDGTKTTTIDKMTSKSNQFSSKDEIAIKVDNISKSFKVYYDKNTSLKERLIFSKRNKYDIHQVIDGISFEVKKGEAIGLIGCNGCGKSTTLKMLSKIMTPDKGTITMNGRVSALIELGAGFHPDMSGRENIYTNASIFGLSHNEVNDCIDDIIEFSELGEFIDMPVRTYSSGMYLRLAFSVAINVKADILLVDEILAVGDAAFQAKCFNKMREIKSNGTTIVIVSHSLAQIEQICENSYWIDDGKIRMEGEPRKVHAEYMRYMSEKSGPVVKKSDENDVDASQKQEEAQNQNSSDTSNEETVPNRWGSGEVKFENVKMLNSNKEETNVYHPGEEMILEMEYNADKKVDDVIVGIALYRADNFLIYGTNTLIDHEESFVCEGKGKIILKLKHLPLLQEHYKIDLALHKPDGFEYDFWQGVCEFKIASDVTDIGVSYIEHIWERLTE